MYRCFAGAITRPIIVFLPFLSACGGGGGGGSAPSPSPTPQPPSSVCLALPQPVTLFGGVLADELHDVLVDSKGRILIAGYRDGLLGESNIGPTGNAESVVRLMSRTGTLIWDAGQGLSTAGIDVAQALTLGKNERVFVAGRTTGVLQGNNQGQFDTYVAWGVLGEQAPQWQIKQVGDDTPQHPYRIAVDAAGHVVVAGENDTHVAGNAVQRWEDATTLKFALNSTGDQLAQVFSWQANSSNEDHQRALALEPRTDGSGAIYTGGVNVGGDLRGMVVRKFAADGRLLWQARYSNTAIDAVNDIVVREDGSVVIAGTVMGSFRGNASLGNSDVFVAQIHPDDGRVLWSRQFGSSEADAAVDLLSTGNGHLYLLGETTGDVVAGTRNVGAYDAFALHLDANGYLLSGRQWGSEGDEMPERMTVDSCGNALVAGSSTGGPSLAVQGARDGFLWQLSL